MWIRPPNLYHGSMPDNRVGQHLRTRVLRVVWKVGSSVQNVKRGDRVMVRDRLLPMRLDNVPRAGSWMSIVINKDGGVDVCDLPTGVRLVTA